MVLRMSQYGIFKMSCLSGYLKEEKGPLGARNSLIRSCLPCSFRSHILAIVPLICSSWRVFSLLQTFLISNMSELGKSFNLEGWSDHGLEMMKPLSFDYCECHVMLFLQQLVLTLIVFICCIYKFYIDNVFLAAVVKHCWGQNLFIRLFFCTSLQACFGWKHYWQMLSQLLVFTQSKNFTSVFEYKCPRLSLLIIISISKNQQNRNDFLFYYSKQQIFKRKSLLWAL